MFEADIVIHAVEFQPLINEIDKLVVFFAPCLYLTGILANYYQEINVSDPTIMS